MQRNIVRLRKEFLQRNITHVKTFRRIWVVGQDLHAETLKNPKHGLSDFPGSHHTGDLVIEIRSHEAVDAHVKLPRPSIRLVGAAVYGQKHGHGVFRHRLRGVAGNPQHGDPALCRTDVHVVKSRTAKKQALHLIFHKPVEHFPIHMIVYENTYRVIALCQEHGIPVKGKLDEANLEAIVRRHRFKPDPVIGFGTEKSDLHRKKPSFPPESGGALSAVLPAAILTYCHVPYC